MRKSVYRPGRKRTSLVSRSVQRCAQLVIEVEIEDPRRQIGGRLGAVAHRPRPPVNVEADPGREAARLPARPAAEPPVAIAVGPAFPIDDVEPPRSRAEHKGQPVAIGEGRPGEDAGGFRDRGHNLGPLLAGMPASRFPGQPGTETVSVVITAGPGLAGGAVGVCRGRMPGSRQSAESIVTARPVFSDPCETAGSEVL